MNLIKKKLKAFRNFGGPVFQMPIKKCGRVEQTHGWKRFTFPQRQQFFHSNCKSRDLISFQSKIFEPVCTSDWQLMILRQESSQVEIKTSRICFLIQISDTAVLR